MKGAQIEENVETVNDLLTTEDSQQEVQPEYTSIDDLRGIDLNSAVESTEEVIIDEGTTQSEAEYTPDFTYKVRDEVLEFDESLRGSVTSKESEDLLRDLYTKSMGLDGYKTKNSELETELGELKPRLTELVGGYENIQNLRDTKDYHRLIKTLNWKEDDVIDFAEKLLEESEMPDTQRTETKANRDLTDKVQLLESQLNNFQDQNKQRTDEQERAQLTAILSNDAYSDGVTKLKEVGVDFEQDVISIGTRMFNDSGRKAYPSMGEVVARAYEMRQPLIDRISPVIQTNTEPVVTNPIADHRKPTLPKVTGTNSNAIEEVMTLDMLKGLSSQIPT